LENRTTKDTTLTKEMTEEILHPSFVVVVSFVVKDPESWQPVGLGSA